MNATIRAHNRVIAMPAAVRPLLQRLGREAAARGVAAYAVGGCVRDWWLGRRGIVDVDVVVEGDGIDFAQAMARELAAPLTTHRQFGTATLTVNGGLRLDVATCRKESYARPAAYPTVAPGTLRDDLFRRDFTINAMALALAPERFGARIDPFGGARDLAARRLRILHPRSFTDDPSRILRAARFAPRYHLRLGAATRLALRAALADGGLQRLNRGRLRKELAQMLREPDPVACLDLLGRWLTTTRP